MLPVMPAANVNLNKDLPPKMTVFTYGGDNVLPKEFNGVQIIEKERVRLAASKKAFSRSKSSRK